MNTKEFLILAYIFMAWLLMTIIIAESESQDRDLSVAVWTGLIIGLAWPVLFFVIMPGVALGELMKNGNECT